MPTHFIRRFQGDERGTATVESLLWMPLFFYLFVLITDVSFIFYGKAEALRIIQDGNRAYSVNSLETDTETSAYIKSRLVALAPASEVTTSVVNGVIITTATMQASDLMAVGSIPTFVDTEISITSQHYMEN
ncbi:TadE/TadG family type IV pilus assembly protein [Yoonia litorea]|uniref:TadE-like protein n=1 Tax=Yoonia litorea TaxID=1123755 RepID=A0A1I6N1E7_9RHOB|nr:hypothetical protein [Yoonia litorea]SFS21717.1 TadE-like protein [Yoonia litorea]